MPWGRLDDGLYDHPKLDALGRDRLPAVGLWTLAISWCNRRLTDGVVPLDRVRLLGGTAALAERLVEVGLFDRHPDGYAVHDFLVFNDSREHVEARREIDRQRKRKTDGLRAESTPASKRTPGGVHSGIQTDSGRSPDGNRTDSDSRDARAGGTRRASGRASRPDPTESRPMGSSDSIPTAGAPGAKPPLQVKGFSRPGSVDPSITLDRRQLDAWSTFGPEWDTLKAAWLARGLRYPPSGAADDEGTDSQRAILWQILDAQPHHLPGWIAEAPKRLSAAGLVDHILKRWHAVRDEANVRAEQDEARAPGGDDVPLADVHPAVAAWLAEPLPPGQAAAEVPA